MIDGTFLSYSIHQPYFICHGRKISGYCPQSLNKLGFDSLIRQFCIWVKEWPWFEYTITTLIMINSICLGLLDYKYENRREMYPDNPALWQE